MARETRLKVSRAINVLQQKDAVPERERKLDIDALLTPEQKAKIRQKAADKIAARDQLDAEDQYLKEQMAELDKAAHPEIQEEERMVMLDLPDYANPIKINGRDFWSGRQYTLPVSLIAVLLDQESRAKKHLRELEKGNSLNQYRQRNVHINPDGSVMASDGRPVRY